MFQFCASLILQLCFCLSIGGAIFFSGNIKDSYYRYYIGDSVVRVMNLQKTGGGSGFHVEAKSGKTYILTNAHVCEANTDGKLLIEHNGEEMIRNVVKVYDQHDLCLIESMPEPEGVLEIAGGIEKGEDVVLIGHPGLRDLTLSHGEFIGQDVIEMVNDKIQSKEECSGKWITNPLLQMFGIPGLCVEKFVTSAVTTPAYGGNSGSPVVNKYGNVVGVLFAGSDQVNDSHMVPLNSVKDLLKGF